ncbi:MAG: metallophosphoesterase, partial [Oscillospiraceae bacterium]|nr:metallophosphoesterase [Oscillospiraceae bacterium]
GGPDGPGGPSHEEEAFVPSPPYAWPEEFPEGDGVLRLTILHTNDLHGNLENMPYYSTIVSHVRGEEMNVLLLDGGDLYRRGIFETFKGALETEMLNAMGYDAMAFGNNDFPLSDAELYDVSEHTIVQMAEFPVLCGNVTVDGGYMEGFLPYVIAEFDGVRVAIVGVTSMKPRDRGFDLTKRYEFLDPVEAAARLSDEVTVTGVSDIAILLSHAGLDADVDMRGFSAIVSADTHVKLSRPQVIYPEGGDVGVPIVQAGGEQDNYLGRLDLVYVSDGGDWKLAWFDGFLYPLTGVAPDGRITDIHERYLDLFREQLLS